MFFSLIICTLGERKFEFKRLINSLEQQTYKDFEIIVLSQKNHPIVKQSLNKSNLSYKHIELNKIGLSYARNQGFHYCNGNYITISDDDCWYPQNAMEIIANKIEQEKNKYDIFSFKIFDPVNNIPFKNNYASKEKLLNQYSINQCSSIEIFFPKEIAQQITFDENFGVGAKYPSGEENIFLMDLLLKRYKIGYIPIDIVYHKARTTRQTVFDISFLNSKYHLFQRMYGKTKGSFLYYIFYFKKIKRIKNRVLGLFPFLFNKTVRL